MKETCKHCEKEETCACGHCLDYLCDDHSVAGCHGGYYCEECKAIKK